MDSPENRDSNGTTADSCGNFPAQIVDSILNGDISDTAEDITTETISKGRLKHEMRMLQTRFMNSATALENSKNLSKAREEELLDQINTLTIRLNLATARYDALVETTTESAELKADLVQAITCKRRLLSENEELHSQLNLIREILITKLPKKVDATINMDISNYSTLTSTEFDVLNKRSVNNLSTLELVKFWVHTVFTIISQNINHHGIITDRKFNSEENRKHVQFVDLSSGSLSNSVSVDAQRTQVKCSTEHNLKNVNNNCLENDGDNYHNNDSAVPSSVEIIALEQQIHLMKLDKEFYLKQLFNLRTKLQTAEETITSQEKLIADLESNSRQIMKEKTKINQTHLPEDLNSCMKTDEVTKLIRTEFEKLKSIDQELHNKEISLLREQKLNAICECAKLKTQLEQKECTLKQLREKVEEMQVLNMEQDNQLRGKMRSVLMNLELEQAARKDASLEIEKLNVQLDVSKKSYYELEARFNQERAVWRIKEDNYEKKLQLNETAEREINELLVNLKCDMSKSNTSSSMDYNLHPKPRISVLLEKIKSLIMANDNLQSGLENKSQEMEGFNKAIKKEMFSCEQTSYSHQTFAQKDNQIHSLHKQLIEVEKEAQLYKQERDRLENERNVLCEDLERILTRRQSLARLREYVLSLLQQVQANQSFTVTRQLQNQNCISVDKDIKCGNFPGKSDFHNQTSSDYLRDMNRVSNIHQQVYDILRSQ
uniref:Uncharacterized protein n=1 Tax=Trichobilharzia regenti TaxID=157069 RepID=A0AA85JDK8_TRIRE|nr:unnamed protein product [Trichobilharzia regenti]